MSSIHPTLMQKPEEICSANAYMTREKATVYMITKDSKDFGEVQGHIIISETKEAHAWSRVLLVWPFGTPFGYLPDSRLPVDYRGRVSGSLYFTAANNRDPELIPKTNRFALETIETVLETERRRV